MKCLKYFISSARSRFRTRVIGERLLGYSNLLHDVPLPRPTGLPAMGTLVILTMGSQAQHSILYHPFGFYGHYACGPFSADTRHTSEVFTESSVMLASHILARALPDQNAASSKQTEGGPSVPYNTQGLKLDGYNTFSYIPDSCRLT